MFSSYCFQIQEDDPEEDDDENAGDLDAPGSALEAADVAVMVDALERQVARLELEMSEEVATENRENLSEEIPDNQLGDEVAAEGTEGAFPERPEIEEGPTARMLCRACPLPSEIELVISDDEGTSGFQRFVLFVVCSIRTAFISRSLRTSH